MKNKEKVFVTAVTHFHHQNIIGFCDRPFRNVKDMNEKMVENWNSVVSKNSKVFHLGDVSFGKQSDTKKIVQKLNGYKILIMGNHDEKHDINWWQDCGFDEVYKYPIIYYKHIVMMHKPSEFYTSRTPYIWLYGHVHNTEMYSTITSSSACMCVERWEYKPVELEYVMKLVNQKKTEVKIE